MENNPSFFGIIEARKRSLSQGESAYNRGNAWICIVSSIDITEAPSTEPSIDVVNPTAAIPLFFPGLSYEVVKHLLR